MKVCPACQQTYADDSLNFCLNDGSVLVKRDAPSEPPATVFMNQPNLTNSEKYLNQTAPTNWAPTSPTVNQPKRKSRAWIWVLGIFGAVILLCGGGLVGLILIVPNDDNRNISSNSFPNSNIKNNNISDKSKNVLTDDLSRWKMPDETLGVTDYQNNEFYMTSRTGGYYFVLLSGNNSFRTENATTRVSVRNTTGVATQSGFGLMIHNNVAAALAQDYAFLIDSVSKSYRIVQHQARKENVIAKWTIENSIKTGTQLNTLEARDADGKIGFYINGKLITTVMDKDGIKSGVPGLYASGGIPIAFSNLQIER